MIYQIRSTSRSISVSDPKSSSPTDLLHQDSTSVESVSTSLRFDGERFVVVGTVLLLLPMMVDYVNLAPQLPCRPGSVAELAGRLAELLNVRDAIALISCMVPFFISIRTYR